MAEDKEEARLMRALSKKKEPVRIRKDTPSTTPTTAASSSTAAPVLSEADREKQRLEREEYNRKMEAIRSGIQPASSTIDATPSAFTSSSPSASTSPSPPSSATTSTNAAANASPAISRVVIEPTAFHSEQSSTDAMARKEEERLARMMGSRTPAKPAVSLSKPSTTNRPTHVDSNPKPTIAAPASIVSPRNQDTVVSPRAVDSIVSPRAVDSIVSPRKHEVVAALTEITPRGGGESCVDEGHITFHSGGDSGADDDAMARKEEERLARLMGRTSVASSTTNNNTNNSTNHSSAPVSSINTSATPSNESALFKQVLGVIHVEKEPDTAPEFHAVAHKAGGKEDVLLSFAGTH